MPLRNVWFPGHNKPPPTSPIVGHVQELFPHRVPDEPVLSPSEVFIEEKERMERVACRQAAYNEASCGDLAKINEAIPCDVLDFDPNPEKETELLTINKEFSMKLKSHQIEGVRFMWNACFESIERIKEHPGSGCILAHCMGLGKSLQIVTLVHTVLTNEACQVENVLIVCPVNIILNWENEFAKWLPSSSNFKVYGMASQKDKERTSVLRSWLEEGGVLIIGYDMFRILTNEPKGRTLEEDLLIKKSLIDPGPQLIICDEGHTLKNQHTLVFKTLNKVKTKRRIVLSGTPIQNSLMEYYALVDFVKPNLLGTTTDFKARFLDPIDKGKSADATDRAVTYMKQQSHVLHKLLGGLVQRFDVNVLSPFLPPKLEYVLSVRLSELQALLYEHFLKYNAKAGPNRDSPTTGRLFAHYHELARLWTHPKALLLGDGKGEEEENLPESSGDSGNDRSALSALWSPSLLEQEDMTQLEHSGKLLLLFEILHQSELVGDKLLIFSQSLVSLNVIEEFLAAEDKQNRVGLPHTDENPVRSWKLDKDYFRIDGQTELKKRERDCNTFNNPKNIRARMFLISTKAGGMGINLTAANRVIIFDASWNPSNDIQSIYRVYRLGQQKPCFIYRFLAHGTMEEKIYFRQILKQSLSCRVLDEQQIGRHFKSSDVDKLYEYDSHSQLHRPTPLMIKDPILAGLTIKFDQWIASYHEHDSLLQTIPEEQLSEGERTAAWNAFENNQVGT